MNNSTAKEDLGSLKAFENTYKHAHGYIAVTICIFGIAMNLCNIHILTRKNMKRSPTNMLLAALASCDIVTEAVYLPFAVYFYIKTDTDPFYKHHQIGWIYYAIISLDVTHVTHTAALWLAVSLATFRFISVCQHTKANKLCSVQRARLTIGLVIIVSILFCVPGFLCYGVVEIPAAGDDENGTVTWMGETNLCQHEVLKFAAHVALGGVNKCCACTILVFLTARLLISLHEAKKRRKNLMRNSSNGEKKSDHKRTTAMLTAVALCFVLTEFPQGVLVVIASADAWVFNNVYVYLADFLDDLVLLNSSVNFILYTTMSHQFRQTFYSQLIQPVIKHVVTRPGQASRDKYQTEDVETAAKSQGYPLINRQQWASKLANSADRQRHDSLYSSERGDEYFKAEIQVVRH